MICIADFTKLHKYPEMLHLIKCTIHTQKDDRGINLPKTAEKYA